MGLKSFTSLQVTQNSVSQVVLPDAFVPGAKNDEDQTVYVNDYSIQASYGSDDTPTPAEILVAEITIDGTGTEDIDLTAAAIVGAVDGSGNPAATEDLTGKKLCYLELHSGTSNAGDITVAPNGTNGYTLFGAAITQGIKLHADKHEQRFIRSSGADAVSATKKIVTITGTAGDTLNLVMVFE